MSIFVSKYNTSKVDLTEDKILSEKNDLFTQMIESAERFIKMERLNGMSAIKEVKFEQEYRECCHRCGILLPMECLFFMPESNICNKCNEDMGWLITPLVMRKVKMDNMNLKEIKELLSQKEMEVENNWFTREMYF